MNTVLIAYGYLGGAIVCEVAGSAFLQKSQQFSKLGPTLAMAALYLLSFYLLSQSLKSIPLGVAYAIWGGLGIILTTVVSVVIFRQSMDAAALAGIGLIVLGVMVINVFSKSASH